LTQGHAFLWFFKAVLGSLLPLAVSAMVALYFIFLQLIVFDLRKKRRKKQCSEVFLFLTKRAQALC
jgi:hypothetical protein